jgi:hypothetical protein
MIFNRYYPYDLNDISTLRVGICCNLLSERYVWSQYARVCNDLVGSYLVSECRQVAHRGVSLE